MLIQVRSSWTMYIQLGLRNVLLCYIKQAISQVYFMRSTIHAIGCTDM